MRTELKPLTDEELADLQFTYADLELDRLIAEVRQSRKKVELFDELLPAVAQVMDHKADKKGMACCYKAINKLKEVWKKVEELSR